MKKVISDFKIKSPLTGNAISDPIEFNLMFKCQIGPQGKVDAFLRPETAQGIFSIFKLFRSKKLPFLVGQTGSAFRNEISTGNGLIRTREFAMAEIEHFYDPEADPEVDLTDEILSTIVPIWTCSDQLTGNALTAIPLRSLPVETSRDKIMIFHIYKMFKFCGEIGIDTSKLRFREQLNEEMAHYATQCYDLECRTSQGWIECAGIADRGDYDLQNHSRASNQLLHSSRRLEKPYKVETYELSVDEGYWKRIGIKKRDIKAARQAAMKYLATEELKPEIMEKDEILLPIRLKNQQGDWTGFPIRPKTDLKVKVKVIDTEPVMPHCIEPSYGISRLVQTVLEHTYRTRLADGRKFFLFPVSIAPISCSIITIRHARDGDEMSHIAKDIRLQLMRDHISFQSDLGGNLIGKKYKDNDEIGIPFTIAIDDQTILSNTVTIRYRDTLNQIRIPIDIISGK